MSGIDEAYNQARVDLDRKQAELLTYIRPRKTGNGWGASFVGDGAEDVISGVDAADRRLADVRADYEAFLKLTDGEPTLAPLLEKLARASRVLSDAELEARRAVEHSVRVNKGMSVREAEGLPVVQVAYDKRDRLQSEVGPVIETLRGKVQQAKAILEKYN